ncbi:MAG: AarF/ABC1/UbiB kinase family protein [Acidobacteriota bacterium]
MMPDTARESDTGLVASQPSLASAPDDRPGVIASIPRRTPLTLRVGETAPPQFKEVTFKASRIRALARLAVWVNVLLTFWVANLWDRLRRTGTPERRAALLRRLFERTGGTAIKVGQHLAMRLDLLPWEYGNELSKMLDRVPAFPARDAIAIIEKTTGRPLWESFSRFDPEPVGSTSLACTYQGVLRNGEKVVVKVRRPGVGELFMDDLKVFDWLLTALEFLTVLRPGSTYSMRRELRETLAEELDFVREARYMGLFRRAARQSGKRFFSAPKVHFELSGENVIVQEFVAGMWLWELLAAVEQHNEPVLALARQLGIEPGQIARRLAWINYWTWHEHFFFRADPHPDRIILSEGGKLTFIDFGSVGAVGSTKRRALQQNMYYAWKQDPLNMARASLVLLEPLPAVDPNELTKELETYNWQMLFAFESRRGGQGPFSRTSAWQWMGLIRLARRFSIVIDFHILRLLRGSVMYDTLAVRLDPTINVIQQYRRFAKYRAARARQRVKGALVTHASRFPDDKSIYLEFERLANTADSLFYRMRHALAIPRVNFSALMSKGSFAVYMGIRLGAQVLGLAALATGALVAGHWVSVGEVISGREALAQVTSAGLFRLAATAIVFLNTRKLLFRMDDKGA